MSKATSGSPRFSNSNEINGTLDPIKPIMEQVIINSTTWDRECHGLYDFDLSGTAPILNNFVGCGYVQRKGQNIRMELPDLATEQANQNNSGDI